MASMRYIIRQNAVQWISKIIRWKCMEKFIGTFILYDQKIFPIFKFNHLCVILYYLVRWEMMIVNCIIYLVSEWLESLSLIHSVFVGEVFGCVLDYPQRENGINDLIIFQIYNFLFVFVVQFLSGYNVIVTRVDSRVGFVYIPNNLCYCVGTLNIFVFISWMTCQTSLAAGIYTHDSDNMQRFALRIREFYMCSLENIGFVVLRFVAVVAGVFGVRFI